MSISDLKHTLRKYDFPICAKEALIRTEQLLVGRGAPSSKQLDVAMDIIAEFVFYETDRRGGRRGAGLSPLQELQLIDVLCDYLSSCANETTKNTVFLSLFGGMEGLRRLKILSILASMAVSASSTPGIERTAVPCMPVCLKVLGDTAIVMGGCYVYHQVLLAVGVWLQQMGCSSAQSLQLAENIIRDHFFLNTSNQASLRSLATTAPLFVSNFITAVTELYMHDQTNKKMPPKNLLEVVTSWVYTNPNLCMSAQLNPSALPSGAIPMAAVTPLAGLMHWCALAPLFVDEDTELVEVTIPLKKIKLESEAERSMIKQVTHKPLTETELYIKLHLGVLHSLRAGRRTHGPPTAVNAQHLAAMLPVVQSYAHGVLKRGGKLPSDTKLQNCLDRIGQAVQVALANGCVYGNINSLLASLETLPENRLLRIIVKTQQHI